MKNTFRISFATVVVASASFLFWPSARAQDDSADTDDIDLGAAIEAHLAREAGEEPAESVSASRSTASAELAAEDEGCSDGTVLWPRTPDVTFCATICTSDAMCAEGEHCVVLDPTVTQQFDGPVKADDVADVFEEVADTQAFIDANGPILDDPPVCEGECGEYTGDLTIVAAPPLALCDPFFDDSANDGEEP